MSVRTGDRSEGTLGVLNEMRKLCEYTLQICRNEKVFPKSSRWIMAKPIVDECLSALTCIRRANAVYVKEEADWRYRRNNQVMAHSHLDALLSLMDAAYTSFQIEDSRVEFWTGLVLHTDDMLKSWMRSDKERYTQMFEEDRKAQEQEQMMLTLRTLVTQVAQELMRDQRA